MAKIFTNDIVDYLRKASKNYRDESLEFLEVGETYIIQLDKDYEDDPTKPYQFTNVEPMVQSNNYNEDIRDLEINLDYSSSNEDNIRKKYNRRARSGIDRNIKSPYNLLYEYTRRTKAIRRPLFLSSPIASERKTTAAEQKNGFNKEEFGKGWKRKDSDERNDDKKNKIVNTGKHNKSERKKYSESISDDYLYQKREMSGRDIANIETKDGVNTDPLTKNDKKLNKSDDENKGYIKGKKKKCCRCSGRHRRHFSIQCNDSDAYIFSFGRCIMGPFPDEPILGVLDKVLYILGYEKSAKSSNVIVMKDKDIGDGNANIEGN